MIASASPAERQRSVWLHRAAALALITIFYNLAEGAVSVIFGLHDETLSLFGFGLDSFVEVISGIGIWHMIVRMRHRPDDAPDLFEQRALKITGCSFYVLSIGLLMTAVVNMVQGHHPENTVWGIVVAAVSIATMSILIHYKAKIGKTLGSAAIQMDANCSKACLYLSLILLGASAGYALTGIGFLDELGALWIAWYAYKEGREAFEKAKGKNCCACGCS